jgi:16S rRNA (guanine527-N7)-methyltransferase
MNQIELAEQLARRNISFTVSQFAMLERYHALLSDWNQRMNLTAIIEAEEVREKHFLDCLCLVPLLKDAKSLVDVGSGAGFPAIPLAIALPALRVTMVEPIGKRTTFLSEVVKQLGLKNTEVVNGRAEEFADRKLRYEVATARAVAALPILLELCTPLVKVNGLIIAMKGSSGMEELDQSKHAMEVLNLKVKEIQKEVLPSAGIRYNIVVQKVRETPIGYPRNYSQIKKKPL